LLDGECEIRRGIEWRHFKRPLSQDRISLVPTGRWIVRYWRGASDTRHTDGSKATLIDFIRLRLGELVKRRALAQNALPLGFQYLAVILKRLAPLTLLLLRRQHQSPPFFAFSFT
jgi:hypothetical protein